MCWLISCFRLVQKFVFLIIFSPFPQKLHKNFIFGFHWLCINGVMLAEILCCLHSLKGVWEMGRGVYIWLEIRTVFPMPLSYSCSARLKGPWCTPFLGWTRACPPQSLSPKMSAMRRDDTGATHTIWAAPLLNTFMLFEELWQTHLDPGWLQACA